MPVTWACLNSAACPPWLWDSLDGDAALPGSSFCGLAHGDAHKPSSEERVMPPEGELVLPLRAGTLTGVVDGQSVSRFSSGFRFLSCLRLV